MNREMVLCATEKPARAIAMIMECIMSYVVGHSGEFLQESVRNEVDLCARRYVPN